MSYVCPAVESGKTTRVPICVGGYGLGLQESGHAYIAARLGLSGLL